MHDALVLRRHGGVRIFPAAEDAQALELRALQVEILVGIAAAGIAHLHGVHFQLLAAKVVVHLDLDGQPVAVPARHVGRVKAAHGPRLDDEVLQRLVQARAQVNRPVGVGRPVVQHVDGLALMGFANPVVNPHRLPFFEPLAARAEAGSPSWGSRSWAGSAWTSGRAALRVSPLGNGHKLVTIDEADSSIIGSAQTSVQQRFARSRRALLRGFASSNLENTDDDAGILASIVIEALRVSALSPSLGNRNLVIPARVIR